MPSNNPSNRHNPAAEQEALRQRALDAPVHVRNLVRDGQTVQAIMAYREEHPVGLKEAKDVIDEIARQLSLR